MIIELENAGLSYDGITDILSNVMLRLREGEFRFLCGPSGAGKTTLMKLIYLSHRPTRGQFRLFGEDTADISRNALCCLRRRIGVVFQEFRLLEHLSAFDNVALPLKVAGIRKRNYRNDVAELLDWVGLGHRMNAKPATLSGGEKQRVAIARALVAKPELILADEPTGNIDPDMSERIMRLFTELNRLGAAVLVATHDLHMVRHSSRDVLYLDGGHLDDRGPSDAGPLREPA